MVLIQQNFFISKITDKALFFFLIQITCKRTILILTITLALLTGLSICNSESNKTASNLPTPIESIPLQNMRTYLLGGVIVFPDNVTATKHTVPAWTSPIVFLVELLPSKLGYLDKVVLTVWQTITMFSYKGHL